MNGELKVSEPHPAAIHAAMWVKMLPLAEQMKCAEAFSSTAIEGNRLGEVCAETFRRLLAGEPVSDRYILGLAWTIRHILGLDEFA